MDWLLLGLFILLFEGETTSETLKSQLPTRKNVPPVLQRLLLSDVSNIQLSSGRRSYFGAAPEMAGTSDSNSQNGGVDKKQTITRWRTTGGLSEKQYSADASPSAVVGIRKQFENSFQHDNGIQFADVNLGNPESSTSRKVLSGNSSETPTGLAVLNATGSASSTDKTNIADGLTTLAVGNQTKGDLATDPVVQTTENVPSNKTTDLVAQTAENVSSNNTTDPFSQTTEKVRTKTTDFVTQTTDNVRTDITASVTQTTTGNDTSSATIGPTKDPCPDDPGLVAALVVTAMVLAVLLIMLLSLYCRRMVLTCGSLCRCTKYTLV